MRNIIVLTSTIALAACGGGMGAQSAGTTSVSGTGTGSTPAADPYTQFKTPTVAKTYNGVGASQTLDYSTDPRGIVGDRGQQGLQYAGNASTVRDSKISVTYDPRDAIFTLTLQDPRSGAATDVRFQDPGSRTDFGGVRTPQWGVQDFAALSGIGRNTNIRYLQAGDGDPLSRYGKSGNGFVNEGDNTNAPTGTSGSAYQSTTFFYEVPGSTTQYVSFAGYVRNSLNWIDVTNGVSTFQQSHWHLERGAFAYGLTTDPNNVPKTGTGTYTGEMVGTMIYNPTLDATSTLPNYFQWLSGTSSTAVDFASDKVSLRLDAVVGAPFFDIGTTPQAVTIAAGSTFTAAGTATINLVNTGGFTGAFQTASFNGGTAVNIAGSSIDGAFYGPAAQEVGGGFRIVGGTPDQRIDIMGAFTGKKP
ncbi:Transferrin-binding protein B C-lobe/N-lobe beta barrel domain-containing protein [Sphingomonas antarctica]|uniref:transferrin-binding protein-like solute binding protein n=1 Tax=Sphingomonas antarctica TaxID=2040274 RepID=UPI0039E86585